MSLPNSHTIKTTRDHWRQPMEMRYDYVHDTDRTVWNVDAVSASDTEDEPDVVHIWNINAWGQTHWRHLPVAEFHSDYSVI